jgi:hypothetical protein
VIFREKKAGWRIDRMDERKCRYEGEKKQLEQQASPLDSEQ